jgi:hypothetical protein
VVVWGWEQVIKNSKYDFKSQWSRLLIYLGAMVIEARRCSATAGANRLVLWKSQSSVFWRRPHERFMRSETSVFMISDGDEDDGLYGKSTVNFGLQIENVN